MHVDTLVLANRGRVPPEDYARLQHHCQHLMNDAVMLPTLGRGEAALHIDRLTPRTIIIAGGDGTLNEVIGPALKHGSVVGVIPYGTGNDHAAMLGFGSQLQAALRRGGQEEIMKLLAPYAAASYGDENHIQAVDIGRFTDDQERTRHFANSLGLGYFAEVNLAAQAYNGDKPYLGLTIQHQQEALRRGPSKYTISTHTTRGAQEETVQGFSLELLIGQYFGNGKRVNPEGSITDGEAELLILKDLHASTFWTTMARVLLGSRQHLKSPHVHYRRGIKEIRVRSEEPQAVQYDGESLTGARELYATIMPGALRMITAR